MKQRGRKSASALGTLAQVTDGRPSPPGDLSPEQAEIWRAVVKVRPPDWFRPDTYELLCGYCRHASLARMVSREIEKFQQAWLKDPEGPIRLRQLADIREKEVRASLALARSLRITHQSRYRPEKAATLANSVPPGARPWE